ncbi:MAG: tetratricopeptide repeat protein, partial [Elusimicrobia bacterium]|nr:tetratricopeptide repeat protein [Elusimicrobiota bacterium]
NKVLLSDKDAAEFLKEGKTFLFDLYRIPFNGGKGGEAKPLAGASGNGMSNYFARYSPDGKWIVFCKAGSFMLLQPDSQLYIMPAAGGGARKMQCNRALMNSWHSWSPNGKWLVFSSKANGPYTQLFLTHIDEQGNDTPPVLLERLTSPDRAANIPEFVNAGSGALKTIHEQFIDDVSFARAAKQFLFANDYTSAVQAARKSVSINPKNAYAHLMMGEALQKQDKLEEAAVQFTEAVRIGPTDFMAHNELGLVLTTQAMRAEELLRAKEQFGPAPDSVKIRTQNAAMYKEALFHLEEAIRLNPNYAEAHNNLGFTLIAQGELKKALPPLTEAIRLKPDYAQAYNNLGCALGQLGKLDEAIAYFQKTLTLDSNFPEARNNLTQTLQQKRKQKSQP